MSQGSHSGVAAAFCCGDNTSAPDQKTLGWLAGQKTASHRRRNGAEPRRLLPRRNALVGRPAPVHHPGGILAFSPLTGPGTHSPAWNSISWGVETVGEFRARAVRQGAVKEQLIAALAILHAAAGLQPRLTSAGARPAFP